MLIRPAQKVFAVGSSAVIAIAVLTVSPPARACTVYGTGCKDPMPADANCSFNGVQVIVLDNGKDGSPAENDMNVGTQGQIINSDVTVTDSTLTPDKWLRGHAAGALSGTEIQFDVTWTSGNNPSMPSSIFNGKVLSDSSAGGTGGPTNYAVGWYTKYTDRIRCKMPANPAPNPGGNPGPAPTPTAGTALVQQDSDVYDAPNGTGNRLGPESFFLHAGSTVQLVQPCSNDWCDVVLPTPPGGTGWAYQPGFLKVSQ